MNETKERWPVTLRGPYRDLAQKILKKRPHYGSKTGVIEKALDKLAEEANANA